MARMTKAQGAQTKQMFIGIHHDTYEVVTVYGRADGKLERPGGPFPATVPGPATAGECGLKFNLHSVRDIPLVMFGSALEKQVREELKAKADELKREAKAKSAAVRKKPATKAKKASAGGKKAKLAPRAKKK